MHCVLPFGQSSPFGLNVLKSSDSCSKRGVIIVLLWKAIPYTSERHSCCGNVEVNKTKSSRALSEHAYGLMNVSEVHLDCRLSVVSAKQKNALL